MAENRRRSAIKKQDTCIIEDGNTRIVRTPRRVSFAQTLTIREFECHEYNGSSNDESSSREDVSAGEIQSCSVHTTQHGHESSPNRSLTEEIFSNPLDYQPKMIVEAPNTNTLICDSEIIVTDKAMTAFRNENRLNQTVVFSNMDDSACGMDLTANISQLPETSFTMAAEDYNPFTPPVEGEQHGKPGFHRRPSFSNDFCDGVFIKRYPKLLDDLFKLGKSSQTPSNQWGGDKAEAETEPLDNDDSDEMEMTSVFLEDIKRKALNDITKCGMLTPIEEMSILSRNVSLADPDLVAGKKFHGSLVPAHLHQVYLKLDKLKHERDGDCPIDKENIPVIPFPGQSTIFKEALVDTSVVHSGDPTKRDVAEFSGGKLQVGYKLFQNESRTRETVGSTSAMELTTGCSKIFLMGPGPPQPRPGTFLSQHGPSTATAMGNFDDKTLYMEDGGEMELTSVCTRTIHLQPDLRPPTDGLQYTQDSPRVSETSNDNTFDQLDGRRACTGYSGAMGPNLMDKPLDKNSPSGLEEREWADEEMLRSQTVYMGVGEDMELTNVCTKTIHLGPNPPALNDNSSNGESIASDSFKGQMVNMKDVENREFGSVFTTAIDMGPNLTEGPQSRNNPSDLQENNLTNEKIFKSQTVYMDDGEDMEFTSVFTKTMHMGPPNRPPPTGDSSSPKCSADDKFRGQAVHMADTKDMELTSVCTKAIHMAPSQTLELDNSSSCRKNLPDQPKGQPIYMADGQDIGSRGTCTKTINLAPSLQRLKENSSKAEAHSSSYEIFPSDKPKGQTVYMEDGEDMEFTSVCTKTIHVGPNPPHQISSASGKNVVTDRFKGQTVYMEDGEGMEFTSVSTKTIHVGPNPPHQISSVSEKNVVTDRLKGQTVYMEDGEGMEFTSVCTKTIHVGPDPPHQICRASEKNVVTDQLKGQTVYMEDGEGMEFTSVCTKTIHMGPDPQLEIHNSSSKCSGTYTETTHKGNNLLDNSQNKNNPECLQENRLVGERMGGSQTVLKADVQNMGITSASTRTTDAGQNLQSRTNTPHNANSIGGVLQDVKSTSPMEYAKFEVIGSTNSYQEEPQTQEEPSMDINHSLHLAGPPVAQPHSGRAGQYVLRSQADSVVSKLQLATGQKTSATIDDRDGTKNSGKGLENSFKRTSQESLGNDPVCKRPKHETEVTTSSGIGFWDQSSTLPKEMAPTQGTYHHSQQNREASMAVQSNGPCDSKANHDKPMPTPQNDPENNSFSSGAVQDQPKTTLRQDLTRSLLKDLQIPLLLGRPSGPVALFQKRKSCNFNLLLQPRVPAQPSVSEHLNRTANLSVNDLQVENQAVPLTREMNVGKTSTTPGLDFTGPSPNNFQSSHSASSFSGGSAVSFSQHESPDRCLKKSGSSVLALSPLPDDWDPIEFKDNGQLDTSLCDSLEMIHNQAMPELADDGDDETGLSKIQGENPSSKMFEIQGHQTASPITFPEILEELGVELVREVPLKQVSVKTIPLSTVQEKLWAKFTHLIKAETLEEFLKELTLTINRSEQACESMLTEFSHQIPAALKAAIQAKREGNDPASLRLKAQEMAEACRISARAKWKRHKADHLQKYIRAREAAYEGLNREVGEVLKGTEKLMELEGEIDQCLEEVEVLTSQQSVLEDQESKLKEIESETDKLRTQCDAMANQVSSLQKEDNEALERIAEVEREAEELEDRITWMRSFTEWSLLENTETQMDFGFLFGTIVLQVKLTSQRERILDISLKSRIGEQSRPWAKFVHNLALSSIDCHSLMRSYKDYSQLRWLLNDISHVISSCRHLVDELKLVHLQHQLTLTENRVTIVMMIREALCKIQLDTEITPNTYPDTPLQWTIVPLIRTVRLDDVKSAVSQVPGGYKYIERTLAAVSQRLTERK